VWTAEAEEKVWGNPSPASKEQKTMPQELEKVMEALLQAHVFQTISPSSAKRFVRC